ncbi:MAG: hypothetical protein LBJ32_01650 [Oscillospiraceae bacterium]|jgi:uncharacterized small protein (DUF1192 family)|nr:hypothetical protein [Oscillospiraceae bacterium]
MGVFEDMYVKFRAVFEVVGDKASQIVDVSKLKIKIAECENQQKHEFEKLGRIIYRAKKNNILDNPEIESRITAIDELNNKINILKSEINDIKDRNVCDKNQNENKPCVCNHCKKNFDESDNSPEEDDSAFKKSDD